MARTEREQEILDAVAERKDEAWVEEHEEMLLAQARKIGEI